jgi:hypothetical protein
MATVFFSYSHADELLRDQIEKQLALLKRQGLIETWHDRRIGAGSDFAKEIDEHVESDDIVLLLVSADFLDSDYCYEREMARALERHDAGDAIVIPVILRPCDWQGAPFGHLNATPPDGRPITKYPDRDEALLEVTKAVRAATERANTRMGNSRASVREAPASVNPGNGPRSSNLALAREFTKQDQDRFKLEAFDYMANFFDNSLAELRQRNEGIDVTFRRIDANRFTSIVYRNGEPVARATIYLGEDRSFADGIAYSSSEVTSSSSYNELLTAKADDEQLYFKTMGMSHLLSRDDRERKLTMEGAAELYWSMLVAPLQPKDRSAR